MPLSRERSLPRLSPRGEREVKDRRSARRPGAPPACARPPLSEAWALALLALLCFGAAALVAVYEGAPTGALEPADPALPALFTAEAGIRAREHVGRLVAMGVKVVGSEQAETAAPDYILETLFRVRDEAHGDVAVEVGVQRPSGSFNTDFLGGISAAYENVTNIVCRISTRTAHGATADALLINAHFDTAIGSPGASDDLSHVGVMLETARELAGGHVALPRAVIFLFNGAEEFNWLGAHGFITSSVPLELYTVHATTGGGGGRDDEPPASSSPVELVPNTWAPTVRGLVNLEAIGSAGRALLTRTTPGAGWMTAAYKRSVRHPRGNVIADDIFRAKIFPGDTDLRALRDFGSVEGMDIIFVENGYGYHTASDAFEHIRAPDLARMGGQLVGLRALPDLSRIVVPPNKYSRLVTIPYGNRLAH